MDDMKWIYVLLIVAACKTCGSAEIDQPVCGDYTTKDGRNITMPVFLGFGNE